MSSPGVAPILMHLLSICSSRFPSLSSKSAVDVERSPLPVSVFCRTTTAIPIRTSAAKRTIPHDFFIEVFLSITTFVKIIKIFDEKFPKTSYEQRQ